MLVFSLPIVAQTTGTSSIPATCGPNDVEFVVHKTTTLAPSQISGGKSRLIIFSEAYGKYLGCPVVTRVALDGSWLGASCLGTYISAEISPGQHHLCANIQAKTDYKNKALFSFLAEPGKTYYFRATTILGMDPNAAIHLDALNSDEGGMLSTNWQQAESKRK